MNYAKKLLNVFMLIVLSLSLSSVCFAAGGLNLELVEQTPDLVNPGSFVYVSVKVSNFGSDNVVGATLAFEETLNFKVADGQDSVENLGVIAGKNSVIKRFKILVGGDAPLGLNSLKFVIESDVLIEDTVDILVGSTFSGLNIKKTDAPVVAPGEVTRLDVTVENLNLNALRDMVVVLNLADVDSKVFSLNSGTNLKVLGDLSQGKEINFGFDLIVSPEAESKPYLIPADISFKDDLGNEYTKTVFLTVKIFSEPVLSLSLDSQEFYSTGKGTFTFAIANPGTSSIKGTLVEVLDGDGYNVLSGLIQYVGDLNPDDFQTIQSDVFVESEDVKNINLKVSYLDSYNQPTEKLVSVPVSIYSDSDIGTFGLAGANKASGSSPMVYVVFVILLVGAFYFGKKRGRNK